VNLVISRDRRRAHDTISEEALRKVSLNMVLECKFEHCKRIQILKISLHTHVLACCKAEERASSVGSLQKIRILNLNIVQEFEFECEFSNPKGSLQGTRHHLLR